MDPTLVQVLAVGCGGRGTCVKVFVPPSGQSKRVPRQQGHVLVTLKPLTRPHPIVPAHSHASHHNDPLGNTDYTHTTARPWLISLQHQLQHSSANQTHVPSCYLSWHVPWCCWPSLWLPNCCSHQVKQ